MASTDGSEAPDRIASASMASNYQPVFSPDGEKIAYTSLSDLGRDEDVYVANASGDGGVPTNVSSNDASDDNRPDFSPDGEKVAFVSDWLNQLDVYVANADGSGTPTDMTEDGYNLEPDWGGVPDNADTTKPTVVPVGPISGTTDATPLIRATVRDTPVNPLRSGIRLFVDGKRTTGLSYDRSSGKLSYQSTKLKVGSHKVRVEAKDTAGNATTKGWEFAIRRR